MLDKNISDQVRGIFASLKSQITFAATSRKDDEKKAGLLEFLNDIASTSEKLSVSFTEKENTQLSFKLLKDGNETGITFRGIPTDTNSHRSFWLFSTPTDRARTSPTKQYSAE
mgnify:CR=1 FL=1